MKRRSALRRWMIDAAATALRTEPPMHRQGDLAALELSARTAQRAWLTRAEPWSVLARPSDLRPPTSGF